MPGLSLLIRADFLIQGLDLEGQRRGRVLEVRAAFSPHSLRHRRVSLLHLGGMAWARIGEIVGHDDIVTTTRTYTHVVADERELDYAGLLK